VPTDPHRDVLYRELSIVQLKEFKPSPTTLLQEVVNFGTNTFVRCALSAEGEENVHLAPFALYRHILELTDGIEILVSNASPSASIPLLRSSFEALLALEFILEDNERYESRSLSWLAGYVRDTIRIYRSLLTKTSEGKGFLKAIKEDKSVRTFPLPPEEDVSKAIKNLTHLLSRKQFHAIIAEYDLHKRDPHWYSLFGGPPNLRELARHLRRTAQYDVLYRGWSMSTHAHDFRPFIAHVETGQRAIRGLRDLTDTYQVTTFAVTFIIDATRLLINKFHPGEIWSNWYFREVRDAYVQSANAFPHQ
jgi:hypothetical protein